MTTARQPPRVVPTNDPALKQYLTQLSLTISDLLTRTGGSVDKIAVIAVTTPIDLDYITVTQAVNLDTIESQQTVLISDLDTLEATSITAGGGLTGTGTLASGPTIAIGAGTGITVNADTIQTNDSAIVHDNLSGYTADRHVLHAGVSIIAGTGLTGGGNISTSSTLNVVGGNGITANANDIEIDTSIVIDKTAITDYVPANGFTDRTWDANAAEGAISSPPTQAEIENIRDAVLEISDVLSTLVTDLGIT